MGRLVLENFARQGRQVIDRTDKWIWTEVLNSFEMYVMDGDASLTPHLVQEGFWESWITEWFTKEVKPGHVFWDIGANCGYYTFLAHTLGASVLAFEPNPDYVEMIRATKARHHQYVSPTVAGFALSDTDGNAELYVPQYLHGSSSFNKIPDKYNPQPLTVPTVRLDSVINGWSNNHHLIKMDVEGAEEKVWDGMGDLLKDEHPKSLTVMLEYTPGAYSEGFLDKLEAFGDLQWINADGDEEPVSREFILSRTDWIMLVLRRR